MSRVFVSPSCRFSVFDVRMSGENEYELSFQSGDF